MKNDIRQILLSSAIVLLGTIAMGETRFSKTISSPRVNAITQDSDGFLLVGTNRGLNRYSGSLYQQFFASSDKSGLLTDYIYDLYTDPDGYTWVGGYDYLGKIRGSEVTSVWGDFNVSVYRILPLDSEHLVISTGHGLTKLRRKDNTPVEVNLSNGLENIREVAVSKTKEIWAPYNYDGRLIVEVLDGNLGKIMDIPLGQACSVDKVFVGADNSVWIATEMGLHLFNGTTRQPLPVSSSLSPLLGRGRKVALLADYGSDILLGLSGGGLYRYNPRTDDLANLFPEVKLPGRNCTAFVDKDSNIWLSGEDFPLTLLPKEKSFEHYTITSAGDEIRKIQFEKNGVMIFCTDKYYGAFDPRSRKVLWEMEENGFDPDFMIDSGGLLWCVTDHDEISIFETGGTLPSLVRAFRAPDSILSLCEDASGIVWIVLNSGVLYVKKDGEMVLTSIPVLPGQERTVYLSAIYEPAMGMVIINTIGASYTCSPERFERLDFSTDLQTTSIVMASDTTVWTGTMSSGIIHSYPLRMTSESFDVEDGLIEAGIRSILEDSEGKIWFSTPGHIVRYDPSTGLYSTFYDIDKGEDTFYGLYCGAVSPEGVLYFGGGPGVTIIRPSSFVNPASDTPLHLLEFSSNGEAVIPIPERISLSHDKKNLSFTYSGLDFFSGELVGYSYMLDGFDKDWIPTNSESVSYSNLRPGNYVFRARVKSPSGKWSRNEIFLPIRIRPSLWQSLPMKILYVLVFLALLLGTFWTVMHFRLQKERLDLAEKRSRLNDEHLRFISNASHELRTPLTLIYGPVRKLLDGGTLDQDQRKDLELVEKNTKTLLNISDTILGSLKGENPKGEVLKVAQRDLSLGTRALVANFSFAASSRGQSLESSIQEEVKGWCDWNKVEKILSNLLSNAVKYTPEGGSIRVGMETVEDKAVFKVEDSGIGIPEDKRSEIFERFNRLGVDSREPVIKGHGIGLSYAHDLAILHGGSLEYAPGEKVGSVFTLTIPIDLDSYEGAEREEVSSSVSSVSTRDLAKEHTILLVEDNEDVRTFITDLLASEYNVVTSSNGEEGLDRLKVSLAEVVVSDIMMPFKDGFELCREIKESDDLCHIPVVLLTALSDSKARMQGIEGGADAYIPKPFDPAILLATIRNLIENRTRLQKRLSSQTSASFDKEEKEKSSDYGLSSRDRKFLERLYRVVDENLDDETFSVDKMAFEVGASHTSLYTKIKALTGQSPQAFLSSYRLNVAMRLLKEGELSISEVASSVGASSASNFSRDFKRAFGISPSEVGK